MCHFLAGVGHGAGIVVLSRFSFFGGVVGCGEGLSSLLRSLGVGYHQSSGCTVRGRTTEGRIGILLCHWHGDALAEGISI